eukprot:s4099_g5.t1
MSPVKRVLEIKAHQDPYAIPDPVQRYHVLGNITADASANAACAQLLPEIVASLEDFHDDQLQQREKLVQYFGLNLNLQTARATATSERSMQSDFEIDQPVDVRQMLKGWTVPDPWSQPMQVDDTELCHSVWGFQWAVALLGWIQTCKLPREPREGDPGMSWTEISICLALQQVQWLPVSEIYNEMIKDLFNPDSAKTKKLDVKQNSDGTNSVPGLTERQVNSVEEVLKYMKEAQSNRTVMATDGADRRNLEDMNDESSRSHSIVQVNRKDKTQYLGKINLIDLAGSENVNKSGVQGQGMREARPGQ